MDMAYSVSEILPLSIFLQILIPFGLWAIVYGVKNKLAQKFMQVEFDKVYMRSKF